MFNRIMRFHGLAQRARRHWLLLAVVGLAFVALLAGQPAFATDAQPQINQTVPPPTPRPSVDENRDDNGGDRETTTETVGAPAADTTAGEGASSVLASNQESGGSNVTVDSVTAAVDGWMVVHADADGQPGPVLGRTAVPAGTTGNVVVMLDPPLTADGQLWAMLHVDAGEIGTYEFPGPDVPAVENGNIVMAPFMVTISAADAGAAEATAEPTPEATTEATTEATAEATAEATVEATAEATVEATVEATSAADQAPESLPATGGESSGLLIAAVAGVALLALAGAAFAFRRSA